MTKVPQRGNRSSGSVQEYGRLLLRGYTQQQIADQFGVTPAAVRTALKRHGMPSNPHKIMKLMPPGCTPTDAEVLRRANHALVEENGRLREALNRVRGAIQSVELE